MTNERRGHKTARNVKMTNEDENDDSFSIVRGSDVLSAPGSSNRLY